MASQGSGKVETAGLAPAGEIWRDAFTERAMEISRTGAWLWELDSDELVIHPATARLLGLPEQAQTVPIATVLDLVHRDDLPEVQARFWNAREGQASYEIEFRLVINNSVNWVRSRAGIERDENGRPVRMVGMMVELRPRREAEAESESPNTQLLYQTLLNELDGVVWELDPDTMMFTFVSAAASRILGYPERQWLEEQGFYCNHVHPDDQERVVDAYRQAIARQQDHHFECRMLTSSGSEVWMQTRLRAQRNGPRLSVYGVMLDLSSRRLGEEALLESEERFRTVFERNTAGIALINANSTFRRVNQAFCDLTGRTEDELRGLTFSDITHPDDARRLKDCRVKTLEGSGSAQGEYRVIRPDGEVRWLRIAGTFMRVEGEVTSSLLTATDVTVEKKIAASIKESEEFFRSVADLAPVHLWLVDQQGTAHFMNRAMRDFFGQGTQGWTYEERVAVVHPEDRRVGYERMQEMLQTGIPVEHELRALNAQGSYRWLLVRLVPRKGPDGQSLGYLGCAIDISARKEAEQALSVAHKRLAEQLLQGKGLEEELRNLSERLIRAQEDERRRIARDLHDDLGQRVAALGYALFGLKKASAQDNVPALTQIRKVEEDIAALGVDIRHLSHRLHPAMLELGALSTVIGSLAKELEPSGLHVSATINVLDEEVPPPVALGAYRIVQEALNNVIKHAGVSSATLKVQQEVGDEEDGTPSLYIEVADAGAGFDPKLRGGAGLGLVSIRERVRSLRGTSRFLSHPGEGTRIEVRIPLQQSGDES